LIKACVRRLPQWLRTDRDHVARMFIATYQPDIEIQERQFACDRSALANSKSRLRAHGKIGFAESSALNHNLAAHDCGQRQCERRGRFEK